MKYLIDDSSLDNLYYSLFHRKTRDIAMDTETTGLDPFCDSIVGFSLAWESGPGTVDSAYIPVGHRNGLFAQNVNREQAQKFLKWLFDLHRATLIFHNAPFDIRFIQQLVPDARLTDFVDTLAVGRIGAQEVIYDNTFTTSLGLLNLFKEHVGSYSDIDLEMVQRMKRQRKTIGGLSPDAVYEYACADAAMTFLLKRAFEPVIEHLGNLWTIEKKFIQLLLKIERCGIPINMGRLETMISEMESRQVELHQMLYNAGLQNPHSTAQVRAWLFGILGCNPNKVKKTPGGLPSVDVNVLKSLPKNPLLDALIEYRQITKALNTWLIPFRDRTDENGRLHPQFRPEGTKSGRISCERPNLMAVPLHDRPSLVYGSLHTVIAPSPGYKLVEFDYKQADMRLATADARESRMAQLLLEADPYVALAQDIWGSPVTEEVRYLAKRSSLAAIYGVGAVTLYRATRSDALKLGLDLDISVPKMEAVLQKHKELFPGYYTAIRYCQQYARQHGHVPLWTGRKVQLAPWDSLHKAWNRRIQGGVAEMVKRAMLAVENFFGDSPYGQLLQVHDSLLIELPDQDWERNAEDIREIMENILPEKIRNRTNPPVVMKINIKEW